MSYVLSIITFCLKVTENEGLLDQAVFTFSLNSIAMTDIEIPEPPLAPGARHVCNHIPQQGIWLQINTLSFECRMY